MGSTVNTRPFSNWLLSQLFPTAYLVFFPKLSLSSLLEFHFILDSFFQDPYSYAVPWGSTLETFPIVVLPQPLRMVMEKGFNQAWHRPRAVPFQHLQLFLTVRPSFGGSHGNFINNLFPCLGTRRFAGGKLKSLTQVHQ